MAPRCSAVQLEFSLVCLSVMQKKFPHNRLNYSSAKCQLLHITYRKRNCLTSFICMFVSPGDRPRKLYAERALNLPLGAELITGNMWYYCQIFLFFPLFTFSSFAFNKLSFPFLFLYLLLPFPALSTCMFSSTLSLPLLPV